MANGPQGRRGRLILRSPFCMEFDILFYDGPPSQPTTTQIYHSPISGLAPKGDITGSKPQSGGGQSSSMNNNKSQPSSTDQQSIQLSVNNSENLGRNVPRVPPPATNPPPPLPQSSGKNNNNSQSAHTSNHFQPTIISKPPYQPSPQSYTENLPRTSTPINSNVSSNLRFDSNMESRIVNNGNEQQHPAATTSTSSSQGSRHVNQSRGQSIPNMPVSLVEVDGRVVNYMPSVIVQHASNMPTPNNVAIPSGAGGTRTSLPTSDCTAASGSGSSSSSSGITYKIRTKCPEDEIVERIEDCLRTLVSILRVPISNLSTSAALRVAHNNNISSSSNAGGAHEPTSNPHTACYHCCRTHCN